MKRQYVLILVWLLGLGWPVGAHATSPQLWLEPMNETVLPFEVTYLVHRAARPEAEWVRLRELEPALRQNDVDLTVFYINDLHNKLVIPDSKRGDTYVFAQMMQRIEARRQEEGELVLFLSAGDDHTGEVYDELLGTTPDNFIASLAYHTYSHANLTAAVLGNHEFDRGSQILKAKIESNARFPLLSANLQQSAVLSHQHYASALIGEYQDVRIGVIGLTSSEDTKTNQADDPELYLAPQLDALRTVASELEPHVNLLIALTHIGYSTDVGTDDRAVADMLGQLSVPAVVIGGHSHTLLEPNAQGQVDEAHIVNNVPIVQAGSWGRYLGELQLTLAQHDNLLQIRSNQLHAIRENVSSGAQVASEFQQQIIAPVLASLDEVLNETLTVADDNDALSTDTTLAQRYRAETAIANVITDAVAERLAVDVAAVNASGILAGVEPGQAINFNDWFQVMPYADVIHIVELTPSQLKHIVESNAQRLVRNEEANEFDLTDFVSRGFVHFSSALRYRVREEDSGVSEVTLHGKRLEDYDPDHVIKLALGDYIVNGNQGWRGEIIGEGLPDTIIGYDMTQHATFNTGLLLRNEVTQYLRSQSRLDAVIDQRLQVD